MSHFTVLAMMSKDDYENNLEETLERLFEPYDEGIQVDPYEVECSCVGSIAYKESRLAAEKEVGTDIGILRESYWDGVKAGTIHESDENWKLHIKSLVDAEVRLREEHPLYNKPNPDCEECKGTGKDTSTYNPKSKWDWYQIGGRWDGNLLPYNCIHDGNAAFAHELIGQYTPFAILTSDGAWNEKGKMGWWAMVSDEKDDLTWDEIANRIYSENKDEVCVLVDAHI